MRVGDGRRGRAVAEGGLISLLEERTVCAPAEAVGEEVCFRDVSRTRRRLAKGSAEGPRQGRRDNGRHAVGTRSGGRAESWIKDSPLARPDEINPVTSAGLPLDPTLPDVRRKRTRSAFPCSLRSSTHQTWSCLLRRWAKHKQTPSIGLPFLDYFSWALEISVCGSIV